MGDIGSEHRDDFYNTQRENKLVKVSVGVVGETLQVDHVYLQSAPVEEINIEGKISYHNECVTHSPQDFNLKVGKGVNPEDDFTTHLGHLTKEFERLVEEAKEGLEESEDGNLLEILDAVCDVKFVLVNIEN